MSAWIVYSKDGSAKCEARKLEYSGEFMGACSVNVSISSHSPVDFSIGDYLIYRGERFELNYSPSVIKQSSYGSDGDGFVYENVVFNSLSDELTRCDFLDYVPSDNGMHYSSLPNFSFFAENISDLAERIQVNLDRIYTGSKKWTVVVHPEHVNKTNVNITINNQTCWDALALAKSMFDANFIIKGRTITIGTSGIAVGNLFTYGKNNGLCKIEQNAESNQKIVTRLRAYGSTKNMPSRYYHNLEGGNVPNNMAVQNLMLPAFPKETLDPYLDSKNIEELGVREGTVFFDGSGDLEEIYPTMNGMTAELLKEAGINVSSTGELDVIVSAEQIQDNGEIPKDGEGELQATFTVDLKDIGFDINDYLTSSSPTLSMKDGMCGGREFEIVKCDKISNGYRLTCNRAEDTTLGLAFPYNGYQIKTGDKFVLLNIEMPDVYIQFASQKLLNSAKEYLAKNDYVRYSYTPTVDNIYMARQHDEAIKFGTTSIHDTIKEGDFIMFEDNDLGISGSITIDSLSIKEYADDSLIPEYEITLKEEKTVGTIQKIQNQITSILNGGVTVNAEGGVNAEQLKSMLKTLGEKMFISKQKDDSTPYSLGIGRDLSVGGNLATGGNIIHDEFSKDTIGGAYRIAKNGNGKWEAEADNIIARILASTYDLLVKNHATFVGDLTSEEFISGILGGKGWSIRTKEFLNAAGITEKKSVAEFDELIVRGTMRVYEFIVSQLLGENDNRIFTGMMEVDHYDALEGKIYLKTNGGRLYNPFRVDDVIIVQQYGGMPSEENNYYVTKQYEFIVTEAGVGEMGDNRLDWIRFRNFTTSMEGGNENLIAEYDTLVRLDNVSDANRKGIIQLMSVGEDTPYMDFIHGAKTDPENSLKGRLGNLGGIYNPLFGWLKEFGAYLTNLYAVGEFVIAHTGENVSDSIEIAKGQFRTNYRQTTFDMSEEDNFFTNASLTNNCEHWTLGADTTEYFIVDDLPQFFNFDLYATEGTYAGIAEWKGRDMLRLSSSTARQANSLIKKAGTHKVYTNTIENEDGTYTDMYEDVPDTLYLSVRLYVASSGKVDFGFVNTNGVFINNSFRYSEDLTAREDGYEIKVAGTWDGNGDFCIASTGDVYVDLLSLTDKPLDNFKITTETKIEQDARRIALLGKKVNGIEGSVTNLGIELNAAEERITAYVNKEVKGVEASVSALDVTVKGISTTVASVQGTANDAKSLANAAQGSADDAAAKALAAQKTADSASSKATANATAISQQANSISLLAGAFTLQNGKYVLTSAAGAVITSEVASLYATKTTVNALDKRVGTAESNISTAAGNITALSNKISFDSSGNITNISKSGLVLDSEFASMFTTQVTSQGIAKTATIQTYVDNKIAGITLTADKIDINGVTSINNTFKISTSGYMTCTGGTIANFTISGTTLTNNANNANIIIRNANSATASKRVEIGLSTVLVTGSSGLSSMGLFVDEEVGDASNIALAVSAKNATSNIGLLMTGGCIAGLAEKVGHYNSSGTISHEDNVAVANGVSIYFPEMSAYDDGHVVTIVSNYTGTTNIYCSGNNYIQNEDASTNKQVVSMSLSSFNTIKFVYIHNFQYTFNVGTKQGCWVKI